MDLIPEIELFMGSNRNKDFKDTDRLSFLI